MANPPRAVTPDSAQDACRAAHWKAEHGGAQRLIDFTPPPEPLQPLNVGPTTAQIQAANKRQTRRVLTMLQDAGPRGVSTGEFLAAYIGRAAARIAELRAVGWDISGVRESAHGWRFTLQGR